MVSFTSVHFAALLVCLFGAQAALASAHDETVACFESGKLQVRNSDLNAVNFRVEPGEAVVVDNSKAGKSKKVGDETFRFVYARFPERVGDEKKGWIAEKFVTKRSSCPFLTGESNEPEAPADGPPLQPKSCKIVTGHATFYNPINNTIEGGPLTRHGDHIQTVEKAIKAGTPVTLAADHLGDFGKRCNNMSPDRRCLILVFVPGFDVTYPSYRKKFKNLPKDHFIGLIEDSGSKVYFHNKESDRAGKHLDIAVDERKFALSNPNGIRKLHWVELDGDDCEGKAARKCDFKKHTLKETASNTNCWPKNAN